MARRRRNRKNPTNPAVVFRFVIVLLLLALGGAAFILFFEGNRPEIDLAHVPRFLKKTETLQVQVRDVGSGLRSVEVIAAQGGAVRQLFQQTHPRSKYTGRIGPLSEQLSVPFDAAKLGFKDGPVEISVTAHDFSLRGWFTGNETTTVKNVTLDSQPPELHIVHSVRYISPGSTGIVVYKVSDSSSRHGVEVNGRFNPGFPVPDGRKNTYIAYFALPFDATAINESRVVATDIAGNSAMVPFAPIFVPPEQKHDKINIPDSFLNAKVPVFEKHYPDLHGSLLEKYLVINKKIRHENNATISGLCVNPSPNQLWKGRFLRNAGATRAGYADHRTYYHDGKIIDKEVHLGMDIANVRQAKVKAANNGKVIFTHYLGIYGNTVILDHGQGIYSLYAHMSQINVAVGDMVATGQILGLTGSTGMAGGDHLHFSMLVNGVFVSPLDWWDPHWIAMTITEPLTASKF